MNTNSSSGIANSPVLVPQNLPVGWRFHPTDEELVSYYLKRKRSGDPFDNLDIGEVQLCNYDPWDLPDRSKNKSGDKIWYFFCPREYHKNSGLNKRKTPTGQWKCTGDPRLVTHEEGDEEIGTKRTLVFQNPEATQSQWVIHEYEYTAELNSPIQGNFVLCKLKKKMNKKKKKAEPDCKHARPNKKARKSKSDCNMASDSAPAVENSNSKGVMANSAYGDGEPSNHMISDVDKQNSSIIAAFATYEKGESSYPEALAYDSQRQYEMTSISISNKDEALSFGNLNFGQVIDFSACNKGETRCPLASDLKDHNPYEMTPMSSYMKSTPSCPRASGIENQNSYEMTIVSTNNKGYETSCLKTFDCENQNLGKSIDVSASTECKWSSLLEMPSAETDMSFLKDYLSPSTASNVGEATFQEVQSQPKDTYTPILDDYRDLSMASSTQVGEEAMLKKVENQCDKDMAIHEDNHPPMASDAGEDTFPKINPQLMEELIALYELEDCLNSAPEQDIHNNKIANNSTLPFCPFEQNMFTYGSYH